MGALKGQIITKRGQECIGCRKILPWIAFTKDRSRKNGYRTRCKECKKKTKGTKRFFVMNEEGRECTICGIFKPWNDFHVHKNTRYGYRGQCKDCKRILDGKKKKKHYVINELGRQCTVCKEFKVWNEFSRLKKVSYGYASQCRDCIRAKIYGLTYVQFQVLKARSGGQCEICGKKGRLAIDHDHETGKVRGLLCDACNFLIGLANDDVDILTSAITYLSQNAESEDDDI